LKKYLLILTLLIVALQGMSQQNKSAQANHNVSLRLSNAIEITITKGQNVSFNFTKVTDYQSGITNNNAASLRVKSNSPYNITVKSATSNFVGNSATPMPIAGILSVKVFPQGQFIGISKNDATLLTNQSVGITSINLSYRANPGFNYDAGTYTANIIYTAAQL